MYYYPFSVDSKGASGTIDPSLVVISHIRQSFDLNREASGMVFSSDNNSNILISGTPDTVNTNLVFKPEVNWFLITGDQGTVLTLTELNELGTTSLYFYDDSTGGSADGKAETGDGQSWGDIGVVITGTAIEGRMSFGYKDYFLAANQSSDLGPEFVSNFKFPLNIVQNSQLVPVELVSFRASVLKSKVLLNWTTLSESNNYGFEVQRKSDSEELWKVLGFINGQGTSSTPVSYSFGDDEISSDHYYYRIKQIDFDGSFNYSSTLKVSIQSPQSFQLGQNYPNPFNPETVISYQIPALKGESVEVKLVIYNLLGDEVKTLVQENQGAGFYSVNWNGKDNSNLDVSAATYIYRIKAGEFVQSRKMTLLR